MGINISGPQQGVFSGILQGAFTPSTFERMLWHRLDKHSWNFAPVNADFPAITDGVILAANMEGWLAELIVGAREANPGAGQLLAFAQQFGLASTDKPRQALEKLIFETNSFLDVAQWRTQLGEIETKVCRIEIKTDQGMVYGTGFLFGGPDTILTNYHVMESLIARNNGTTYAGLNAQASKLTCRFDYKRSSDGKVLNPGTECYLAEDWYIDDSPSYPLDQMPPEDHLDYAIFRLRDSPGDLTVGLKPEPGGVVRGFISIPDEEYAFAADSPLFILQHPMAEPLALAFETRSIISLNGNGTRVMHRTNTEAGSSGSPCFSQNWELVALHHSGDPNFARKPTYNEAIPISNIVALMRSRGIDKKIGKQEL
jgi:hypothetical protein